MDYYLAFRTRALRGSIFCSEGGEKARCASYHCYDDACEDDVGSIPPAIVGLQPAIWFVLQHPVAIIYPLRRQSCRENSS